MAAEYNYIIYLYFLFAILAIKGLYLYISVACMESLSLNPAPFYF